MGNTACGCERTEREPEVLFENKEDMTKVLLLAVV